MIDSDGQAALRTLISAAGGDDEGIHAAIGAMTPETVASVLVDELVCRADLSEVQRHTEGPVLVGAHLTFGEAVVHHQVRSTADRTDHGPVGTEPPDVDLELDLVAMVRAVFGPAGVAGGRPSRIEWRGLDDPRSFVAMRDAMAVVQRLLRGLAAQPVDLAELSQRMGSDKWGMHFYTPHYERHFAPLRDRCLSVLELGIGGFGDSATGGGSLRMWKRFFRRAMIYGVDIFDKADVAEQRIHPVRGDFSDPEFLTAFAAAAGPFDIVIDDGSHYCPDVIGAFDVLYRHVRPGGLYVIEDLQTSYWPGYGGSSERMSDPGTSMGFLKQLVDGLNHTEYELEQPYQPNETDRTVVGAHFYHNLVILEKGRNAEGTVPAWMGRVKPSREQMAGMVFPQPVATRRNTAAG